MKIYPFKNVTIRQHYVSPNNYTELIEFCIKKNIHVVNLSLCYVNDKGVNQIKSKGIHVYVAVVDYISDMQEYYKKGYSGACTNWLYEKDWNLVKYGSKKKIIGYTTGVFDMFHVGHLNILKRAKEKCDYLIVGVSTDEVVKAYKNKTPIVNFSERKAIVESIRYVDKVVPQITMNKLDAWNELHFDIMFHGSDWQGTAMYDKIIENLNSVGVEVVFLPHTDGVSSTLLSELLYNKK